MAVSMKSVERWARSKVVSALHDPIADWDPGTRVDGRLPANTDILVIRNDRLGDVLVTTPLLRALRERFPEGRVDILLGRRNAAIGPLIPFVDDKIVFEPPYIAVLRELLRRKYDLVVNARLPKSASTTLLTRAIGKAIRLEYPFHEPWEDSHSRACHIVAMQHRLLEPLGVQRIADADDRSFPLSVEVPEEFAARASAVWRDVLGPNESGTRVLINLSVGSLGKRPSAVVLSGRQQGERTAAELAILLRRHGCTPVLCAAPPDQPLLERTVELSRGQAKALPEDRSFAELAGLVGEADLVVTPDTSVLHLAAALGKPTVALFGSAEWARHWRPWGVSYRVLSHEDGVGAIEPADIRDAVVDLLR